MEMAFAGYSPGPYVRSTTRRTATMPTPIPPRNMSPAPYSAPPVPEPSASSSKMRALEPRKMMPQESISTMSSRIPALEAEIARLAALCEEHERKIRTTRNSVEHRLFSDLPSMLTRLNEYDDAADTVTARLHSAIQSAHPALQSKLSAITTARQADVETMRRRTTPWKTYFENKETDGVATKSTGRIARVDGTVADDGASALTTIERWAEEVEMYLTSEIIRLKAMLSTRSRRRDIIVNVIISAAIVLPLLLVLLAALIYFLDG